MKFLQRQWPFIVHILAVGGAQAVIFLDPSVQAWLTQHPAYAFLGLAVWGKLLHATRSPQDVKISQIMEEK